MIHGLCDRMGLMGPIGLMCWSGAGGAIRFRKTTQPPNGKPQTANGKQLTANPSSSVDGFYSGVQVGGGGVVLVE